MGVVVALILYFLIFSFAGYAYEAIVFDKKPLTLLGVEVPFYPIYGFGVWILLLIQWFFLWSNVDYLLLYSAVATVLVTVFECLAGKLRHAVSGVSTWQYDVCTTCDGYVSLPVSLVWFLFILGFYGINCYLWPLLVSI